MKNKDVIEAFVRGYNASNPTRSLWTLDGILYSYETPIAKASGGRLIWTTDKKYSVTTSKHLSQAIRAFALIGGLLN